MEIFGVESEVNSNLPIGRFGVVLPPKACETIASRKLTLYIQQRLNWVEDGLITFIDQALATEGRLSDYLRLTYPKEMPVEKRRNDTGGERKPLRFRFRYMLRSLEVVSRHYKSFVQWQFSGLEFMMEAFAEVVRQVLGAEAAERVMAFYRHFRSIWQAVNPSLWSEADASAELKRLVDEVDELFEDLFARCLAREASNEAAGRISAAADTLQKASAQNMKAARIVAKVAGLATARVAQDEDVADGLARFNEAQRREIALASRMSHARYPVAKGAKAQGHTISALAERCWREHEEDFRALARLPKAPGFASVKSYKTALYRLAREYPRANHFRWQS